MAREEYETGIEHFTSSKSDEWATPPEFVRPLSDAVGGFDLDPAAGAESSPIARETFTEEDNGLSKPWHGKVWCNPPYSEMDAWTRKVIAESLCDDTELIIYLCKGDSSTNWWHAAAQEAAAVAMIDSRLSFGDGDAAPFCSHVFVFGNAPETVLDVLERRGMVFQAAEKHERTQQVKLA